MVSPVIPLCVKAHVSYTSPSYMHTRHHGKVDYTSSEWYLKMTIQHHPLNVSLLQGLQWRGGFSLGYHIALAKVTNLICRPIFRKLREVPRAFRLASFPGPRPTSCHLQYGKRISSDWKLGEGLGTRLHFESLLASLMCMNYCGEWAYKLCL